jgi:hypothetical protein
MMECGVFILTMIPLFYHFNIPWGWHVEKAIKYCRIPID